MTSLSHAGEEAPFVDDDEEVAIPLDDEFRQTTLPLWQARSAKCALGFAFLSVALVSWWVSLLGGLTSLNSQGQSKQVFNWHPLLMILAYAFMTSAALSFRYFAQDSTRRQTRKRLHGSFWVVAAILALVALIAVFKSHNDATSGFIANLYSFHSWLGLGVVGLYMIQLVVGVLAFSGWTTYFSGDTKRKILAIHAYMGPYLHMAVTAVILLGIQEKEGFVNCSYSVDSADLFPLAHFNEIPQACKVSHTLGILVFLTALCTSFALHGF